ncbi:MAG: alpha/beta hydrolase [Acidobacteriota bacterium]
MTVSKENRIAVFGDWRIAYETRPGAEEIPIVFVHGANSDRRIWHRQLAGLEWQGQLLAIDLLGHGESDKPPEYRFGFRELALGIETVVKSERLERMVLVGHSNGVPTVREYYRLFPEKTAALVLVDGPIRQPLTDQMAAWLRAQLDSGKEDMMSTMVQQMPRGELTETDLGLIHQAALATPLHVMKGGLEALTDPGTWRQDPIQVPVLMLVSRGPMQTHWKEENRSLAESMIEELDFQILNEVTHFFMLERASDFNRRLSAFLGHLKQTEEGQIP